MVYSRYIFFTLFFAALFPFTLINAQIDLPHLSQKASVMQRIGLVDVTVYYSRPGVKERKIWGELVPYDKVWRTGADEATNISFSEDVTLNGNPVPAGRYALFTIPGRDEWTVIINRVHKQWGAFNYDSTKDQVRFRVRPIEGEFTESLLFTFSELTTKSARLNIAWEKLSVSFEIGFDVDKKAYANIKKALASAAADDWIDFAISANYAAENNMHLEEAMQWIDRSISTKPTYYNYYVKAKLLGKMDKITEALKFTDKSREAGKNDPEFKGFAYALDNLVSELKEKNKK